MRLKSLELVGFKSFVDRTVINFEEGVTGIVGPNGCGKSNVVDAIRWVMGEQSARHLRGSSMGDVIFNGTENRPPMGMASVFLTFNNSDGRAPAEYADYSEITIGRRLYRSGESEYYINKTPCRLRDIIDLFLGTGLGSKAYAIVEQGTIEQIILSKPEDRRVLIEEAAGISKFKARKEAAQRKMESTKANLARLSDIIGELERQTASLYRQAKKAERFKNYSDELTGLELTVSAHQYRTLRLEIDSIKKSVDGIKESAVAGESRLSREESEIESARIKLNELELELDGVQESLYEAQNEIQLVEAEKRYKVKDVENLDSQIERWRAESDDLVTKIEGWEAELERANSEKVLSDLKANSAREEFAAVDNDLSGLRDEHHELVVLLEDSRRRLFECVEKVSAASSHVEQLKRREKELQGWIAKDQAEIDNIDEQVSRLQDGVGNRVSDVKGTRQLRLEIQNELDSAKKTLKKQREELDRTEGKVASLKDELGAKRSRLQSLTDLHRNFEGYKEGVRAVLKRREEVEDFRGVIGTINDVVETHPKYENAVGAVLGEKLQYVVVKSHEVGVSAIDYLKTAVSGRSTFVPMELRSEEETEQTLSGKGVIGPLINYVKYSDDYKKIVNYLLKEVVLVEDIKKALDIWNRNGSKCTMVTLDGEVIDPAGVVTGGCGGDSSKQLMEHRREIKELTESVSALMSELSIEEQRCSKLKERVRGIEKNIEKLENESHHEELKLVNQETDLHQLEREMSYYGAQRDKLTLEISSMAEEQASIAREIETGNAALEAELKEKSKLETIVTENQEKERALRERLDAIIKRRAELGLQVTTEAERAEVLEREIRRLISSIAEATAGIDAREVDCAVAEAAIDSYKFSIGCKEKYAGCLADTIRTLKEKHSQIKERFDRDLSVIREREASIRELRKTHDDQMKSVHEIELEYTQKSEKINYMCREIFEKYRVSLETSYEQHLSTELDIDASAKRVEELKDKLRKIGSVNVDAINEYEELKARYDFLKKQHDDLVASLEDLRKAIQKINKTSRARFAEAFESVNERFQKLFPKLFDGGKARLVMVGEENVLDGGVDIVAQPPGKKLQSISLLSGGEKALTAVALVFALFLHRPSPFCLLDEADAPLDDANIDRFNELIREMTRLSQFILITHNKRTMELADTLYGATMEEKGVSKIISLVLSEKKGAEQAA